MIASLPPIEMPIRIDGDGIMRVRHTRVTLQSVISAYRRGESPEKIVENFDVLSMADIYAVLAYYLSHQDELDEYLRQQQSKAEQLRQQLETDHPEMFTMQSRMKSLLEHKDDSH